MSRVTIIGGGFAGVEAAWAAAQAGVPVRLYEMRPHKMTPAHKTGWLAELVCSNSFKSMLPNTPSGQLKWEMEQLGSIVIPTAYEFAVPAGEALAVDREPFARAITARLESHPLIEIVREEVTVLPPDRPLIVATGPLTSDSLASEIARLTGRKHLYFYDAVSPIVDASTIDYERVFVGNRREKGDPAYLNCPFTREEYERFWQALVEAERVPLHDFEEPRFFEGCVPIEELAERGRDTLRFGPLKPVGLVDPRTGKRPYAVLQLRPENNERTLYSLVACQTRLKWGEQKRVFRLVPGLENAEFVRYGVVHRNTYLDSPRLLLPTLQFREDTRLFFAGQLIGVEGYIESAASGIIAGINAARLVKGKPPISPPREMVIGSLLHYIATYPHADFPPMNANWGLLPEPEEAPRDRELRRQLKLQRAREATFELLKTLSYSKGVRAETLSSAE
jgi:methylenetetrahydrofolate--tRNA-(uracil-5-)-methyltransferase